MTKPAILQPEVGTLWRDREGNTWRLVEYIDGGPWCRLRGVIRYDGVPWGGATWHADWMLDLVKKATQIDATQHATSHKDTNVQQ